MKLTRRMSCATTADRARKAMERYAAGDEAAFEDVYNLLGPRLYAYLLRRTRNVERAEDLLQQTLLQVHRARGTFIPGAELLPWAFAIVRRLSIDSARKDRQSRIVGEVALQVMATEAVLPDDVVQAQQLARRLERALAQLPASQRDALELLKRRGLSLSQTAKILQITVGAVKLRVFRAQAALRAALAAHKDP